LDEFESTMLESPKTTELILIYQIYFLLMRFLKLN